MKRMFNMGFLSFRKSEDGQTTILLCAMMVMLMAMTGLTLDIGKVLFTFKVLQATTDAAALAGGSILPATNATTIASQYSAVTGNLNARTNLPGVTMVAGYPKVKCLDTLKSEGQDCVAPANGNAVQVKQQITVPLTFMKVVGISQLTLTATSTAAEKGAQRAPYNVAVIVDTTGSMSQTDNDPQCNDTRINCEMAAVRILLQNLSPCLPSLPTCGTVTNGNVAQPYDKVALYTFPSLKTSTDVQHEYDCSGTKPNYNNYTDPYIFSGQVSNPSIYTIIPFSSDYKTSANTSTLNSSSNLVKAVRGVAGCNGMQALNAYTYIAGAMYQAGVDLINLDSADTTRKGVIIILTDGDMNAPASWMPYASTSSGTYASTKYECGQAAQLVAQNAANYGLTIYTVAYGVQTGGCSTDNGTINACQTVQQLATSPDNFYSDYTSQGGDSSCQSAAHPTANLNTIFQQIAKSLSTGRLIPDNTT